MKLKQISSMLLCEELNYRHGRIDRIAVPELADFETENILAELISRGGIKTGVQVMKITGNDVFDPRIHSKGKEYGFTLTAPAFFIIAKG